MRQDRGDAGADRLALDQRDLAYANAGNVGDGVQGTRIEDADDEIGRASCRERV